MKIGACIITYNPNVERLRKNINSIYEQIDYLFIYDNNSSNLKDFIDVANLSKINFV